jgi:cardiolipin synthase
MSAQESGLIAHARTGDDLALAELAQMPFSNGNAVKLLVDGEATFNSIFDEIESAREYILIQFYIVKADGLGNALKSRLVKKAAEGIRVYFLYDEIGCHKLPGSYIDEMRRAGIETSAFKTTQGKANRFQLNFRNHRKIVVIDGRTAFVGGHNVGDEYMGRGRRFGAWRDTHLMVKGPSALAAQFSFLEDWFWAAGTVPEFNWAIESAPEGDKKVLVISSGPADKLDTCGLMFVHAIHAARHRIWIASPYFVPDLQVIGALQLAALRGVDVRILLPEKADHRLVYLASFSFYQKTLPVGIRIYRYQKGFMHQKAFLVDESVSAVGTANLDNRSFRLNFEITMLVDDRDFAAEVRGMLAADFERSRLVTLDDFEKHSIFFKFASRFSRLFAPIL